MHTCMYVYVHMHIYIYICICVRMCACMFIRICENISIHIKKMGPRPLPKFTVMRKFREDPKKKSVVLQGAVQECEFTH